MKSLSDVGVNVSAFQNILTSVSDLSAPKLSDLKAGWKIPSIWCSRQHLIGIVSAAWPDLKNHIISNNRYCHKASQSQLQGKTPWDNVRMGTQKITCPLLSDAVLQQYTSMQLYTAAEK